MEDTDTLKILGYNQYFEGQRIKLGAETSQIARVIAEHKGAYEVICTTGKYRATVTGRQMSMATGRDDYPAVGDWVVINKDENEAKIILHTLPRKTTLHKKYGGSNKPQLIAANIDIVFIVESIGRDYSLNRFERYLVLAQEGGVEPVIIINKADLATNDLINKIIDDIRTRFGEIDVLTTSTVTNQGLQALVNYIQEGATYSFVGSSGVGKSSLINKLLKQNYIATQTIDDKTGRGRHTTTSREMYFTHNGGIIIDNPGSREVGTTDNGAGIDTVFDDIDNLASNCRFNNCQHQKEPGCAIQNAIRTGTLNPLRFENYQKLQKETKHYEQSSYDKRQKDKKFGKYIKNAKTELKKHRVK